jgi:hypothetical protein
MKLTIRSLLPEAQQFLKGVHHAYVFHELHVVTEFIVRELGDCVDGETRR